MLSHPNWKKLHELATSVQMPPDNPIVRIEGLRKETAIRLAHGLTVRLDKSNGLYRPWSGYSAAVFTLERSMAVADERALQGDQYIFGEERPADRNMAVRVENHTFAINADVRNELEDNPNLGGAMLLRLGLIATVESLEF